MIAFKKNLLYINGLHKSDHIAVSFKKVEVEALIESLQCFVELSTSQYYQECRLHEANKLKELKS